MRRRGSARRKNIARRRSEVGRKRASKVRAGGRGPHLAVGVDLGGTNLRAALVKIDGGKVEIIKQFKTKVGKERTPEAVADKIAKAVGELGEIPGDVPIGVGVAGLVKGTSGEIANAPNLGWKNVPFGEMVGGKLGREVRVENDVNAITWAEHRFGAAKEKDNVVALFLGTGVGGGAVLNGQLYRGARGFALEIGHTVTDAKSGRTLESFAGGRSLSEEGKKRPSELTLELAGDKESIHGGHLDKAARAGDKEAKRIVTRAGEQLGTELANTVRVLDPEVILVGGTTWWGSQLLRATAVKQMHSQLKGAPRVPELVEASLGDDAGVIGAADVALQSAQSGAE